jgi:hypothetical protein
VLARLPQDTRAIAVVLFDRVAFATVFAPESNTW